MDYKDPARAPEEEDANRVQLGIEAVINLLQEDIELLRQDKRDIKTSKQWVRLRIEHLLKELPEEDTASLRHRLQGALSSETKVELITAINGLCLAIEELYGAWIREGLLGWASLKSRVEQIPLDQVLPLSPNKARSQKRLTPAQVKKRKQRKKKKTS
jgi:hypothetical protein